jgi:nicotinate-nucleotide pyrophosphorylase (carboxylating)
MTLNMETPDFSALKDQIDFAIAEDIGDGDHSALACIPPLDRGRAQLIAKAFGIIAGVALAEYIFTYIDPSATVKKFCSDGDPISPGDILLEVEGNTIKLLQSERLVLNYVQRLSGVATQTNFLQQKIKHTGCVLLDTRKTTPGLRTLEKWAVVLGGGSNHRMGLYDMIMLKDNHIDFCGSITEAVTKVRTYLIQTKRNLQIEVETRNLDEVNEAIAAKVDRIMLDNFSIDETKEAVLLIDGRAAIESSGGINESNLIAYAECGVNFISVGALTHQIKALDLSLKAL